VKKKQKKRFNAEHAESAEGEEIRRNRRRNI